MDIECRLCLFKTERDESVNIFTPGKNNELISDTIMSFVPIELSPDDNLPQTICNVCVQKLESIIEFRSLILNSDMELKIKSQNKKIFQESENEISGASDDFKLEIDEVKLEIVRAAEMDDEDVPDDVLEEASAARYQMLPKKSKLRYEKELEQFRQWQTKKRIKGVDEDVMMAYFKSIAASSAWSRYSMLKSTLLVFQNVDISRFSSLTSFLKTKCKNYQPKKAAIFSKDDVCKFLLEAPDQDWIVQKVVLIMGIFGGCRCDELARMMITDVKENFEDGNPTLVVNIPFTKTGVHRSFTVVENEMGVNFLHIYKKYIKRRPIPDGRLFLHYRNGTVTSKVLGVNSVAKIPGQIAEYLKLPEKESFTGHSFRRTSVTLLAGSGAGITTLKRHGSWETNSIAESDFSASKTIKIERAEKISENAPGSTL